MPLITNYYKQTNTSPRPRFGGPNTNKHGRPGIPLGSGNRSIVVPGGPVRAVETEHPAAPTPALWHGMEERGKKCRQRGGQIPVLVAAADAAPAATAFFTFIFAPRFRKVRK